MRVFLDSQIFILQARGGISRYFSILFQNFQSRQGIALYRGRKMQYKSNIYSRLFVFIYCSIYDFLTMRKISFDIYHKTYFWIPFNLIRNAKNVITVFDMNWEVMKSQSKFPYLKSMLKKIACKNADHIITISNSTRTDLINIFDINPAKVTTIYLGVSDEFFTSDNENKIEKKKQILFVGKRSGYKNFNTLLKAFASSQNVRSQYKILCVGGGKFSRLEKLAFREYGIEEVDILQRDLTDSELIIEYKRSRCLVYPSLYEGFGLPILEAGAAGCAVITSNTSSMREIGENACLLVDPNQHGELRAALEALCFDDLLMSELIEKGLKNAREFTWQKASDHTIKLYESLI